METLTTDTTHTQTDRRGKELNCSSRWSYITDLFIPAFSSFSHVKICSFSLFYIIVNAMFLSFVWHLKTIYTLPTFLDLFGGHIFCNFLRIFHSIITKLGTWHVCVSSDLCLDTLPFVVGYQTFGGCVLLLINGHIWYSIANKFSIVVEIRMDEWSLYCT